MTVEFIVKRAYFIFTGLRIEDLLFFMHETFNLSFESPDLEQRFILKLLFLRHECFHEKHVVSEIKELHAKLKRSFLLKNVDQLFPVTQIQDSGVGLNS